MLRNVYAEIDLNAIRHNLKEIRNYVNPNVKICAVVKANAYGHDAIRVSKIAVECDADFLAVATIEEALKLRRANFDLPILILGLSPYEAVETIIENNLTQTISDLKLAKQISTAAVKLDKVAKIHLKVDTGLGRIGINPSAAADMALKISRLPNVELEGLFSHFADADSDDMTFTKHQIKIFKEIDKNLRKIGVNVKIRHIADSAAILNIPESHLDMIRPGIMMYGLYPSKNVRKTVVLRPAMKLVACISYLKKISAGVSIGYGREFVAQRESLIATLPLGYADGYIRAYKNFHVEIKKQLVPVVGRICMDQTMIDVTDIKDVKIGDEVILFGSELIPIENASEHLNTIDYEVICLISSRVPRVFKDFENTNNEID